MYCPNCGGKIREGETFCENCGTRLSPSGSPPRGGPAAEGAQGAMRVYALTFLALFALLTAYFCFRLFFLSLAFFRNLTVIFSVGIGAHIQLTLHIVLTLLQTASLAVSAAGEAYLYRKFRREGGETDSLFIVALCALMTLGAFALRLFYKALFSQSVLLGGWWPVILSIASAACLCVLLWRDDEDISRKLREADVVAEAKNAYALLFGYVMNIAASHSGDFKSAKRTYAERTDTMSNQAQPYYGPTRLKTDRNVILYFLLTVVTCGIYGLFFFHSWTQDVNAVCDGDGKETPGLLKFILLGLVTCGIYSFIWYYKLGNRLQDNGPRYGVEVAKGGSSVLLWMTIGVFLCGLGPLIGMNILLNNTNNLCSAYNRAHGV